MLPELHAEPLVVKSRVKWYPISEIFGPTRQGEGPQAGQYCFFVRIAGCDWNCSWCDTGYAIGPGHAGWHMDRMTADEIVAELVRLGAEEGDWITLSGGNPALVVDLELTLALHAYGFNLAMETQGSRAFDARWHIDCLVVSPKPPSSGMDNRFDPVVVSELILGRYGMKTAVKFVAFNREDLDWAVTAREKILAVAEFMNKDIEWHISAGTPLIMPTMPDVSPLDVARLTVCNALTDLWLLSLEPDMRKKLKVFTIRPQLHVEVWGQKVGV